MICDFADSTILTVRRYAGETEAYNDGKSVAFADQLFRTRVVAVTHR